MQSLVFGGGKMGGAIATRLHKSAGRNVLLALRDGETASQAMLDRRLLVSGREGSPYALDIDLDPPNTPLTPERKAGGSSGEDPKIVVKTFSQVHADTLKHLQSGTIAATLGLEAIFCCIPLFDFRQTFRDQILPLITSLKEHRDILDQAELDMARGESSPGSEESESPNRPLGASMTEQQLRFQRKRYLPPLIMCTRGLTSDGRSAPEIARSILLEEVSRGSTKLEDQVPMGFLCGTFVAGSLIREPPLLQKRMWLGFDSDISMKTRNGVHSLLEGSVSNKVAPTSIATSSGTLKFLSLVAGAQLVVSWLAGHLSQHFDDYDLPDTLGLLHDVAMEVFLEVCTRSEGESNLNSEIGDKLKNFGRITKTSSTAAIDPTLMKCLSSAISHSTLAYQTDEYQFGRNQYNLDQFKETIFWGKVSRTAFTDLSNPNSQEATSHEELGMIFPDPSHHTVLTTIVGFRTLAQESGCSTKCVEFFNQCARTCAMFRRGHEMAENILDESVAPGSWLKKPPPKTPSLERSELLQKIQERGGDNQQEFDSVTHQLYRQSTSDLRNKETQQQGVFYSVDMD